MIEEHARVVRVEGAYAWIEIRRESVCGQCGARNGCGTATLAKVLGRRCTRLRVLNPVGAESGDEVSVGIREQALLRGSLAVYAVPLLSMIALAMLGGLIAGDSAYREGLSLALGGLGLALGLGWVARFSRAIATDPRYQPVILVHAAAPPGTVYPH
jgi:sigma-E factor negative regulatory protein RseC